MKVFVFGLAFLATALAGVDVLDPTLAVLEEIETLGVPPSAPVIDDGYRYKTVRRFRARHRRDVSELSSEYLPPAEEIAIEAPSSEYLSPVASGILADDGYRYKTVRRFRARHRRDVSELPSSEYLPPIEAPSNEYLAPVSGEALASGALADDGYRYRTVRRFRVHRRRRELSSEYLPPAEELAIEAPLNEYLAPAAPASGILADDGYRYKTVRRLRLRHRRDVSELPTADYLPPVAAPAPAVADIPVVSSEYLAPVEQNENILADDGYRYKTVRRFKIRRH